MTEMEIQNSILEFLRFKKVFAWRQNNGGVYDERRKIYRRKSRFELKGVSDIVGVLNDGRFLAIEVKKSARAKVSKEQLAFIDAVNSLGGLAFVAWSIEQVEEKLNATGHTGLA